MSVLMTATQLSGADGHVMSISPLIASGRLIFLLIKIPQCHSTTMDVESTGLDNHHAD
jgi:hypothetical protein